MKLIPYLANVKQDITCKDYNILPQKLKEESEKLIYTFRKVSEIEYLEEKYFKKGTNLGSGVWTIYTHYEVNNKYYQIVFKPVLDDDEDINDYILSFKSNTIDNKSCNILRYIDDLGVFLDTPRFNILNLKVGTKNIFDTAGYVALEIKNIKKNTTETIPIRVLPSSIDYEDYIEMIEDLISIREDIVTTDGGKVGIGKQWELKRNNYVSCIDNIYNHMIQINNNPSSKLSLENTKLSYNKIKKIKPKTIIEKVMYPYKDKYSTTVEVEDLNIYENQIIKYSLIQIKEKIEKYKIHLEKDIKYKENYICKVKSDIEKIFQKDIKSKKDDLEKDKFKIENNIKDIIQYSNETKELKSVNKLKSINKIILKFKIGININEHSIKKISIKYDEESKEFILDLKTNEKTYDTNINKFDYDLLDRTIQYKDFNQNKVYNGKFGNNRKVNLEFRSKNIYKIKFMYDELTNINNTKLDLIIIANRKNNTATNPLLPQGYNSNYTFEEFTIECEDLISINNIEPPKYTQNQIEEFLELNVSNLSLVNTYEKLGFIESLHCEINNINYIKEYFYKVEFIDSTLEKIDKLLNLKFMKNTKLKKDVLKPTQIFINDFSYNKIFRELKKLNKKVKFLDSISPDMYFLKTTANIYEYWCLYKIVNVLVHDLKWTINNKESVIKDMDNLLKYKGRFDKPSIKIELEHNLKFNEKITLDLIYEGKIYYDVNKYKTPDYQFIFNANTKYEKRIYLDAKYRNYKEQGDSIFLKDINNVAIGKYYVPFLKTPNESDVSFIVHSDKDKKYECFGGNHIIEDYKIKEINMYNRQLENTVKNNHRFGAFYLLPSYSFNINKFLRMILEYHLDMYDICWTCGELHNIKVEEKQTVGGYAKYHYRCNECDEFWVKNHCRTPEQHKLIKHVDNYHSINKNKKDPWYVTCPICFNGFDRNSKSYSNNVIYHEPIEFLPAEDDIIF